MLLKPYMTPLLHSEIIKGWDQFTIKHKPISSIDLMETAANVFTHWFTQRFHPHSSLIYIIAGNGNNGGDGLAVARLLVHLDYTVHVFTQLRPSKQTADRRKNFDILPNKEELKIHGIEELASYLPHSTNETPIVVVDAIFGTGISDPVRQPWTDIIETINSAHCTVVSIDLPSGCPGDSIPDWPVISADYTFSFEIPKRSSLWPESGQFFGHAFFSSIGLLPEFPDLESTLDFLISLQSIKAIYKPRSTWSHKGSHGRLFCFCGSDNMPGAALIASRAAYRIGAGLVQAYINGYFQHPLVLHNPEVVLTSDASQVQKANSLLIGPGIGTDTKAADLLDQLLDLSDVPTIIDADGLNILSKRTDFLEILPSSSILTPHPKEFDRLFGPHEDTIARVHTQRNISKKYGIIIVLKGHHTSVSDHQGHIYYNSTGNAGLAKAGSGDALAGIIGGLLAQQYTPLEAAIFGVFMHGYTADRWTDTYHPNALSASDLVDHLPMALNDIFPTAIKK